MTFKSFAVIRHVPDRNRWIIQEPLAYSGEVDINVPIGFETDLASVPRIFWGIIPHSDKHIVEGSIIHDFMYSGHTLVKSRSQADRILRACCKEMKAPPWYYWAVWIGVRIGGGPGWRRNHGVV